MININQFKNKILITGSTSGLELRVLNTLVNLDRNLSMWNKYKK